MSDHESNGKPGERLNDDGRVANAVEDAFTYTLLTEEVGGSAPASVSPTSRFGGGSSMSQLVTRTLGDVLGWKVRSDDAKGFAGALAASFTGTEIEGHTDWAWTPRTYAVQTDLGGCITGAQASLYKRAQEALVQALPLLDGLYPLDSEADADDIAALKAVVRTQLGQLVAELPTPGGPGKTRVNEFFRLLLADRGKDFSDGDRLVTAEPDAIGGTLGQLRDMLGLARSENLVNNVAHEQDQTNFRILADYVTSLAQSWLNNRDFFGLNSKAPFLGTQLVPISRQLSVIAESVDELRFALDSVFIGAAERQTVALYFGDHGQPMYAEDFLQWVQNFVTAEAPSYVQDGGKFGIGNSLLPFAHKLEEMTSALLDRNTNRGLPPGFRTARVGRALQSLRHELGLLVSLARPLGHDFIVEPSAAELQAVVAEPKLLAVPSVLTFMGPFMEERTPVRRTELINLGGSAVMIKGSIADPNAGFAFVDPDHEWALAPGDSVAVAVQWVVGTAKATTRATFRYPGTSPHDPPRHVDVTLEGEPWDEAKTAERKPPRGK